MAIGAGCGDKLRWCRNFTSILSRLTRLLVKSPPFAPFHRGDLAQLGVACELWKRQAE